MKTKSIRERLLATTIICGMAAVAAPAFAQDVSQQSTSPPPGSAPSSSSVGPTTPAAEPSVGPAVTSSQAVDANNGQPPVSTEVSGIVVTGSRIRQPGLTTASPLTVINDQELKLQGTASVETLLNSLPQVFADYGANVSNGASGTATVDLRDLGPSRTLVLIDGKHLGPGDPGLPVADLNFIPAFLVDRVDIVTGGASAVYGSDAVAGVVNFIMKKDFQGVRIDGQYTFVNHQNGNSDVQNAERAAAQPIPGDITLSAQYNVSAALGVNTPDGKGNATAYFSYLNMRPITQNNYDYSACSISTVPSTGSAYDTHVCQGSSNTNYGRIRPINGPGAGHSFSDNPNGTKTFVPYTGALAFNFGPYNYFQRQDDRYLAGAFAHYQINPMFDVYSSFMFMDDHTVAQIAASGLFQGAGANGTSYFSINCNNPLMSTAQATALCGPAGAAAVDANGNPLLIRALIGYRFASFPRQDDLRHTDYRLVLGTKGDLGPGWSYDAYIQLGRVVFSETYLNDVSISRTQNALLVNPNGTCMSNAPGCVPLNIFQFGGITPAMVNYVSAPGFAEGSTTEQIVSASVSGDLTQYGIKSPWANGGVGVALGTEYRRENLVERTDTEFSSGDLAGQGGPRIGTSGTFDVYELYGEMNVPIIQDRPLAHLLSMDLGYRFSQYSTAGITDTYKGELKYAPIRDITFRASYNRAVRAPGVNELFGPQSVGLFGGRDLCATANPTASLAECQRSGVTAAQYGTIPDCPASQCSGLFGGNPGLAPEKSDTVSGGIVFTPGFFRNFTLTADYYDIRVYNIITAGLGGQNIINQCLTTGASVYCNLFHRDPTTGAIFGSQGYIISTNLNTGYLHTSGIDLEANYRTNLRDIYLPDYGSLNFNLVGTWTNQLITQPVSGGGAYDCAGLYGTTCGTPIPHWRHKFRISYITPWNMSISLDWRYIGRVLYDGNNSSPFLNQGVYNAKDARIPAYNYFDLSGTWRVRDGLNLRAGVQNLFDKDPPVVDSNVFPVAGPPFGNGNTYPQVYDSLGRTIFIGLTADF